MTTEHVAVLAVGASIGVGLLWDVAAYLLPLHPSNTWQPKDEDECECACLREAL